MLSNKVYNRGLEMNEKEFNKPLRQRVYQKSDEAEISEHN